MKVQDIAIVGLVVLVLLLVLWNFRSSGYTSEQVGTMLRSAIPPSVLGTPTFMTNVISILLNGTKKQSFLTQANAIIASINATNYFSTQLVPYTVRNLVRDRIHQWRIEPFSNGPGFSPSYLRHWG